MLGARETGDGRRVIGLPGEGEFDLAEAESPHLTGRAVVARLDFENRDAVERVPVVCRPGLNP